MATKTTNYNLVKPAYDESADIGVINANMDIIDTKMKEIENAGGSAQISVDAELSETSTNPVQNKVISSKINELNSNLENTNSLNIKYYNLGTVTMLEALESIFQELYAYKYKLYICRVRTKDTPTLHIYITRYNDFGICFGVSEQNGKCFSYFRNITNNTWVRTNAFG